MLKRRLRALIALAGFAGMCAACGGKTVTPPPAPPAIARGSEVPVVAPPICEADEPSTEPVCRAESAVFPPNISAMEASVWAYYTGLPSSAKPPMTMYQPDKTCSPLYLGNGLYAYRTPKYNGACLPDIGGQLTLPPYAFWATYEIWQDRAPVPGVQQPWYATLAVNFLCIAAYRRAGFTDAQLGPYCSGDPSSTVPNVRHWIHDTYFAGTPFWQ